MWSSQAALNTFYFHTPPLLSPAKDDIDRVQTDRYPLRHKQKRQMMMTSDARQQAPYPLLHNDSWPVGCVHTRKCTCMEPSPVFKTVHKPSQSIQQTMSSAACLPVTNREDQAGAVSKAVKMSVRVTIPTTLESASTIGMRCTCRANTSGQSGSGSLRARKHCTYTAAPCQYSGPNWENKPGSYGAAFHNVRMNRHKPGPSERG